VGRKNTHVVKKEKNEVLTGNRTRPPRW